MRLIFLPALALATLPVAAQAQVVQGVSQTDAAGQTTTVFTITPTANVPAPDYVKLSADSLNYRIAAADLATSRAQRDDVKAFAVQSRDHALTEQKLLYAALTNADRKITRPSTTLSGARQADLDLLRKAPRSGFDTLYLTQQIEGAPNIWALQKGYASDGTDPALHQVALSSVPTIEQDYGTAKALVPAGVVASR